jgi:hypothetical protein
MEEVNQLKWASPEEVVRLAKESVMTTIEIVRIVSGCLSYKEALKTAHDYAPLLDISVSEFMEMRKNE